MDDIDDFRGLTKAEVAAMKNKRKRRKKKKLKTRR
jgi:hypothetical protein